MRVRAKICGITRLTDAEAAIAAGADALGFNFHSASPRYVEPTAVRDIIARLPPFVEPIGLFVDAATAAVRSVVAVSGIRLVQFHGDESDAECVAAGVPFIKALRVDAPVDGTAIARRYSHAAAILLDSGSATVAGGSGRVFDWSCWPRACRVPLILAGGLTPDNVAEAISRTHPYAVDVSSGVEGASKRQKDPDKMGQFISEVQRASRGI
jgi:phosphoribosylanthranilate isomerase